MTPSDLPRGKKLSAAAADFAVAAVQHVEIGQAVRPESTVSMESSTPRTFSMLRRTMTLGEPVVPVICLTISSATAAVAESGSSSSAKCSGGLLGQRDEFARGEALQGGLHLPCFSKSRPNEADVGLADFGKLFAGAVVERPVHVDRFIRLALPQNRDVDDDV